MRIHPHNENLESPRPQHLSFKQLCNVLRGVVGRGIGGVLGLAVGGVCAVYVKYYKQSPFYLLADIVKHLENHITLCISHFRL